MGIVDKVKDAVENRKVKVYRIVTRVGKGENYNVGLDLEWERMLGVKVMGLNV